MNPPPIFPQRGASDEDFDLVTILDIVIEYRRSILAIIIAITICAGSFAFLTPPMYRADMSVQVEDNTGLAAAQNLLDDVSSLFDYNSPVSAEQQIMASRLVAAGVVDELHTYIGVEPARFPLIGGLVARLNGQGSPSGQSGSGGWAWGAESADVTRFDVPESLLGRKYILEAMSGGRYRLSGPGLESPVVGKVGRTESVLSSKGRLILEVAAISAPAGTHFKLVRNSRLDAITDLQMGLDVEEKIKSSGVLIATLRGRDAQLVHDELSAVGRYYVNQNANRKAAEAAQSLAFLQTQVPALKRKLEDAEARYTKSQEELGSIDLPEEAKVSLQQVADATTRMLDLKQKREQLAARFTTSYPDVVVLDRQIAALDAQKNEFQTRIKAMPAEQQAVTRLALEVKIDTDLYTALLNNVQQLELVKAGKIGSVRVVDSAVTPESMDSPNRPLIVSAGAIFGVIMALSYAFGHNFLFNGIAEASEIEAHTGLSTYATIPLSEMQERLASERDSTTQKRALLAEECPDDLAVESLRSLCTALQFAINTAHKNLVLISGPTAGVGKSFISANLALLLARGGARVLLVDADLRRGFLHHYFGVPRNNGLSDYLSGRAKGEEYTHSNVFENLNFIATGAVPPNPAELLTHALLPDLLEHWSATYDIVILDSSPVLAVTDGTIIARHVGVVLLVARAARTRIGEISETIKRFAQVGINVNGAILNGIDPTLRRYAYGRRYGTYRYAPHGYDTVPSDGATRRINRALARLVRRI